jgi:hypothetical protein
VALTLLLAACGSSDDTTVTSEPTTTASPTTAAVTSTIPTTTTTGTAPQTVFGWLRSFNDTGGAIVVAVDQAEMLSGEAAVVAARQDGAIGGDEVLPNDYYIRNVDEATSDFDVSSDVEVILQACYPAGECVTTEQVDLDTWSILLGAEINPGLGWDWYGAGSLPYLFTVHDGVITHVVEQYLP